MLYAQSSVLGQENPAFDGDSGVTQIAAAFNTEEKNGPPDLVSTIVRNPTITLPLYEISLNGNHNTDKQSGPKQKNNNNNDKGNYLDGDGKKNAKSMDEGEGGDDDDDEDGEDTRCGLGCCSPEWIQSYATKRTFMVIFSLLGVIQGMTWSYFTATITSLEKRFKISSQTAGKNMKHEMTRHDRFLFGILPVKNCMQTKMVRVLQKKIN